MVTLHDDGSNKTLVADIIVHLHRYGWRTVVVSWFNWDAVLYFGSSIRDTDSYIYIYIKKELVKRWC